MNGSASLINLRKSIPKTNVIHIADVNCEEECEGESLDLQVSASLINLMRSTPKDNVIDNGDVTFEGESLDLMRSSCQINLANLKRSACHRCGNVRKNQLECTSCPQVYCKNCTDMMIEEHGDDVYTDGCTKFKKKCCWCWACLIIKRKKKQ